MIHDELTNFIEQKRRTTSTFSLFKIIFQKFLMNVNSLKYSKIE